MFTEINISNDYAEYNSNQRYGYVDNTWYIAPKPQDHRDHISFGMCGVEAQRVVADCELNYEQVMYLLSRLRRPRGKGYDYSTPTSHVICLWMGEKGRSILIGGKQYNLTSTENGERTYCRDDFNQWLDIALQETFE